LENHEVCLYVASEPLLEEEALQALSRAIPQFERYQADGQAEVISSLDWYLAGGSFDPIRVQQGWIDRLNLGLVRGYAGLRSLVNVSGLPRQDRLRFAAFEESLDATLAGLRVLALCAYPVDEWLARDVFELVRHHQFTLAKRDAQRETLNGSELRRALDEIQRLNAALEQQVFAAPPILGVPRPPSVPSAPSMQEGGGAAIGQAGSLGLVSRLWSPISAATSGISPGALSSSTVA
jgi:hypothetical protein